MIAPAHDEALYLFYVTKAEFSGDVAGDAKGPDISSLEPLLVHHYGDFVCVLGIVPINDFCGPEAERNLNDLGWVGERALRHQRVIEQGFGRGSVLPARFGTLFSSLPVLERFIEVNRPTIDDYLERVQDREEWGIKALLERATAHEWLRARVVASASSEAPASPGLRYIQQRRSEAAAEKQLRHWLLDTCESIGRSLDDYASDRRQREIFDAAIPDDSRELVLNLAALIPRERRKDLIAHIENINTERAEQGLSFVLNGPWPPYSFYPPLVTP
jgi:Gas vesicle synthesis protein GvpL/GvpF